MGWIYRITSPSGKKYHGQTSHDDPNKRWNEHKRPSSKCRAISRAISKYGHENMIFEPLYEISYSTHGSRWREFLDFWEKYEIEWSDSMAPNGYNLNSGGSHPLMSDETRVLISIRAKERRLSEEVKQTLKRTPEQRKRLSIIIRAQKRKLTVEHRAAISVANKGKRASEETKARMRDAWRAITEKPGFLENRKEKTTEFNRRTKSKSVGQYTKEGTLIKIYKSQTQAYQETGVRNDQISRCALGKPHNETAGGFVWKFI